LTTAAPAQSAQDIPLHRNGFPVQILSYSPVSSAVALQGVPSENFTAPILSLPPSTAPTPTPAPALADQVYPSPEQLLTELRASYARALDYPESVFTEDADLEADLGVDSVKQAELLARVTDSYALNTDPADFRLAELTSLAKISAFVLACMRPNAGQPRTDARPSADLVAPAVGTSTHQHNRAQILDELRATYAAALDYPASVFAETADLEADLGVDSVKQTELLAQVSDHYALALHPDELRLTELTTLGSIADLVLAGPANGIGEFR
jgi:acyl carrier protein